MKRAAFLGFIMGAAALCLLGANFGGSIGGTGSGDIISATAPLSVSNANVSCAVASGSAAGCLSSTDWTTFSTKITNVTSDQPLSGNGTSASHLVCRAATGSVSGCLSSTDWTTFNGKQQAISVGALSAATDANGLTLSSGTLSCELADGTHGGCLSAGTQTIAGDKTYTGNPTFSGSGNVAVTSGNISVSSGNVQSPLFASQGPNPGVLDGQSPNGASAVGVVLDNLATLSTPGAKLVSVRNNGVEKAYFDKDGNLAIGGVVNALVPETLLTSLDMGNILAPASLTTEGSHTFLHAPTITQMTGYISLAGSVCSGNLTFQASDGTNTCTCAVAASSATDTAWSCSGSLTGTCALSAGAVRFNLTGGTCTTQPKVENWDIVGHY